MKHLKLLSLFWNYKRQFLLFGLALFLVIYPKHQLYKIEKDPKLARFNNLKLDNEELGKEVFDPELSIANYILSDSVISVLQSYYVDRPRASNEQLLHSLVSALNKQKNLKVEIDASNNYSISLKQLSIRREKLQFYLGSKIEYSTLLTTIMRTAFFIHKNAEKILDKKTVEKFENDPTIAAVFVLDSLLMELDPHSNILSEEQYQELKEGTEGYFGGLGLLVSIKDRMLSVLRTMPNSPASNAGIMSKDKIVEINGFSTYGVGLDFLMGQMRGEPGSKVELTILRENFAAPEKISLHRKLISVETVASRIIELANKKVALYLEVESFSQKTSLEVANALKKAKKIYKEGLIGVVIDLRSNPGGLLDQAVKVADLFVNEGVLVSTRGRLSEVEIANKSTTKYNDLVTIILQNSDSASASEILAGALQDHNRAIVIGEPSFGKGSVQTVFELPTNRALKLTIARYYTPLDRAIQNVGISPDIWLQPVYIKNKNFNLLGDGRYQGEYILKNHLSRIEINPIETKKDYLSGLKSYNLIKTDSIADVDLNEQHEIVLSKIILNEVASSTHSPLNAEMQRASFWLNLASPNIHNFLANNTFEASQYLSQSHTVDWYSDELRLEEPLKLQLRKAIDRQVGPGEYLVIPWKIENPNNKSAQRVSVYMHTPGGELSSQEFLIGSLKSKAAFEGEFVVRVPGIGYASEYNLLLGYAIDSESRIAEELDVGVEVIEKQNSNIELSYSLEGPNKSLAEEAVLLRSNSKANLVLKIKNKGALRAKNLKVDVVNLSGRQINLTNNSVSLDVLEAYSSHEITVPIEVANEVMEDYLKLGVSVDGHGLRIPTHMTCNLRAQTNSPSYRSQALSH